MINILHVIDTRGPGGAESIYLGLIENLPKDKFRSFAVVSGTGYVLDKLRESKANVSIIQSKGSFNIKYLIKLMLLVRKYKIDIIQAHLFGSSVYCSLVGFICKIPVISTFHGFIDTGSISRMSSIKFRIVSRWSTFIVFVSNSLKKRFVADFKFIEKKSLTIYNGINKKNFKIVMDKSIREKFDIKDGNILIGSVGNIRPAKGYEILLLAASKVLKKIPNCRFAIAGQGKGELVNKLKQQKADLGIDKKVHLIGFQENVSKFYSNIDIFVSSSYSEGFSLSTVEALAFKLPIVVTKSGGPEEIIENNKSGLIVQPNSPDLLADAIKNLILNHELREECIKGGKKVLPQFLFDKTVENYSKLYRRACNLS